MQDAPIEARTIELMREGARFVLDTDTDWQSQLQDALHSAFDTLNDPSTNTSIRRYNMLSILHWASSTVKAPDRPVEPYIDPEIRLQIREQIRRGRPETILNGYRAAQIVAWREWMTVAFQVTSDKEELERLLEYSAQQINTFSQNSIDLLSAMIDDERAAFARRSPDLQYQAVMDVLDGTLRDPDKARHRLAYRLDRSHQAVILWSDLTSDYDELLDSAADQLEFLAAEKQSLRIKPAPSTLWIWLPTPIAKEAASAIHQDGVKLALGRPAQGFFGFKESHKSASSAQRTLIQSAMDDLIVSYEDTELADLVIKHPEYMSFAQNTLGRLFDSPAELRESVRVYLKEGCNGATAAKALDLHRNTLNRHLERANDLLPAPLGSHNRISVAAALESLQWV
ncbi:MAG: helix-turn-helix domain-containing protein [Pseudomonadota bacterium]